MEILFLSRWFPYPANNGSKLRIFNLLQGLAQKHNISLLSFIEEAEEITPSSPLHSMCQTVQTVRWAPFNPGSKRAQLGFFSLTPRSMVDTFSAKMQHRIETMLSAHQYDLVIASQIDMAVYSPCFRGVPALFEEVEIAVLYEQYKQATTLTHKFRYGLTWAKHRRYLISLLKNFRACTVVSNPERELLSGVINGAAPIEVMPNCVNLLDYNNVKEMPKPNTLIFTGAFSYFPNYEAMQWFLEKVYPIILSQIPDAQLKITGKHGNRPLPFTNNVTLTGFVPDVRPLIASSWASIVPLHSGGGTRLKILEAMALRVPVIATSKGAEGLEAQPDKHLLIADTPTAFAKAVILLLQNPDLRQKLSENAYQLICKKYDWNGVMPHFLNLVDTIANRQ